jgi:prepilin-type processing-associated H-X9-DG protein
VTAGRPWANNDCGPKDELFSFHTGGANVVFADGRVRFNFPRPQRGSQSGFLLPTLQKVREVARNAPTT